MKKSFCLCLIVLIILGMAGCGGGGSKTQAAIASITVYPSVAAVVADGGTQQFTATALDANGQVISGVNFTWSTDAKSGVGSIASNGIFTAGATLDTCNVTCSAGGKTQSVQVKIGHLKEADQQLVDDIVSTGENMKSIKNTQVETIMSNTQNKVVPNFEYIGQVMNNIYEYGYDLWLYANIFTQSPGSINYDTSKYTPLGTTLYTGTWNVSFTGTPWQTQLTRSVSGSYDVITIQITSSTDTSLKYQGTVKYYTASLKSEINNSSVTSETFNVNFTLVDKILGSSTFAGDRTSNETDKTYLFSGSANFSFKDASAGYIKLSGDMKFNHKTGTADYFKGTVETSDLLINGAITMNYVTNSYAASGLYPNTVKLNGSVSDKTSDPIKLEGILNIAIANASTFNENLAYSSTNYLKGSITFDGTIQANSMNKFVAKVIYEEVGWHLYKMTRNYTITNGGVSRTIGLMVENKSDTQLHLTIDSSWGPAEIDLTLNLTADTHQWADANGQQLGTLSVNGTKKADIFKNGSNSLKVQYNNGSFTEIY